MDEFKKYNHEENDEISRIYDEIEKEFGSASSNEQSAPEVQENVTLQESEPKIEPVFDTFTGIINTVPSHNPTAETPVFYSETIKKDDIIKNEKRKFRKIIAAVVVGCLITGSVGGYLIASSYKQKDLSVKIDNSQLNTPATAENTEVVTNDITVPEESTSTTYFKSSNNKIDAMQMSNLFVDVVKKVEPSVVAITTLESASANFFGMPSESTASGTGVIFSEDDDKVFIITNAHVINSASAVKVSIMESDGISAKFVGSDPENDLAVISVLKSNIKEAGIENIVIAEFGDSDKLQIGEFVLAIGNAFGQGNSTTFGIISTKEKEIKVGESNAPLKVIQTQATINFGNSGGPLINLNGEVIGINTAKYSPMNGAEGMGYSIGSNRVIPVVDKIMGRTNKPFLGITGATITKEISEMYGFPEAGVYVNSVFENSSASNAGIKNTDIITTINGETMFTMEQLSDYIKQCKVGDTIKMGIIREGKIPMTLNVTLEKYQDLEF